MYFIIIVIGIVANKCDLYNNEQVSTNEGIQFAKETKCLFFETTCKSGDNVNEIGLGRGVFAGANLQTLKVYSTLKSNITLDQITSIGTLEKNNPLAYLL